MSLWDLEIALWDKWLRKPNPAIGRITFAINNKWPTWLEPLPKTAKERKRLGL